MTGMGRLGIFDHQCLSKVKPPCFIYDLESIGKKIERINTAFKDTSFTQYYPVKANPCPDIVRYCIQGPAWASMLALGETKRGQANFECQPLPPHIFPQELPGP